ncbi:MAG TPA: hypothetical protein VLE95_03440 [Chlamydiales bacterium]|nr:hypothetical protein [Chlamydiales bacterium]
MVGALSDSFENQILLTMAEMPRWKEVLKDWEVPSVRDYKKILEKHGFSISHSEIHREVVCSHLANYIPKLPLDVAEEADFQNEFCKQAQNCPLIYKQLLIRIGS